MKTKNNFKTKQLVGLLFVTLSLLVSGQTVKRYKNLHQVEFDKQKIPKIEFSSRSFLPKESSCFFNGCRWALDSIINNGHMGINFWCFRKRNDVVISCLDEDYGIVSKWPRDSNLFGTLYYGNDSIKKAFIIYCDSETVSNPVDFEETKQFIINNFTITDSIFQIENEITIVPDSILLLSGYTDTVNRLYTVYREPEFIQMTLLLNGHLKRLW